MYPFELNAGVERYNDLLREAEEQRRASQFSTPGESWFSRVAKLLERSGGKSPSAPMGNRPATSAR